MERVELDAGPIEYADTGGDGPVVVLVGGLAIDITLWDGVARELGGFRVIRPRLPWGQHRLPMKPHADLTLRGHATILGDFLDALDLRDVTLVESDTGMAQLLAGSRAERIGGLVLCSQEAFDNYPPGLPGRMLGLMAKLPGGINFGMGPLRIRAIRNLPMFYGNMAKRKIPAEVSDGWLESLFSNKDVRRDLQKYVGNIDRDVLLEAAERLASFDRPALVVWATEDKVMPPEHGRRLADLLPDGRLVEIEDSYTLIPLDQPARLAAEIRTFATQRRVPVTRR